MKRFVLSLLTILFFANSVLAVESTTEKRLDEVAERGGHVMPFDLEQTLHIFLKTDQGGVQQVIAKDNADTEQIILIREHLSQISRAFRQGDFSGPEKIHGEDMPGLAELKKAQPGQIRILYQELPNGAEIDYSTENTALIEAIHKWFDAQLSDHARHAVPGHSHHLHHEH